MIRIDQLKLYNQITGGVRYIKHENQKYLIVFLSENSSFTDDHLLINIQLSDVRTVSVPYIRIPRFVLTASLKKQYKAFGFSAIQSNVRISSPQNLLYDPSGYVLEVDKQYHPQNYRGYAGKLLKTAINTGFYLYPDYKKVFVYSVNLNKPLPDVFANRKIFPILQDLKHNNFDYDYFLLHVINGKTSRYRLLVKDGEFNFNSVWGYLKSIATTKKQKPVGKTDLRQPYPTGGVTLPKPTPEETREKEAKIEIATNKIVPHIIDSVKADNVNKISKYVSAFLSKMPSIASKIEHKEEITPHDAHRMAIGAILDKTVNNANKSLKLVKNITPNKSKIVLKKVDEIFTDQFIEKSIAPVATSNPIVKISDVNKLNDNKNPIHLFEKRAIDFQINLKNDIESVFKIFETRDVPIFIDSIILQDIQSRPGELDRSEGSMVIIRLHDAFNHSQVIRLEIPRINTNTGVFTINGKSKCLINQIVPCPISFPSPGDSKFESAYSTFHIESKVLRKFKYLRAYIGSFRNLPLFVVISFLFGFEKSMEEYDIKYHLSKTAPKKQDQYAVKLNSEDYLFFDNIDTELKSQLCNSFAIAMPSTYKINAPLLSKEYFEELLYLITGTVAAPYHITRIFDNIIDPSSRQVLMIQGLPFVLDLIIQYMARGAITGFSQDRNDLSNLRIRGSEIISHLIVKAASQAYTIYRNQVLAGNKNAIFEIKEKTIRSAFLTSDIVANMEYANPVEEMAVMLRVSPVGRGIGGIKSREAVSAEYRNVHPSYFGNIDPLDTPEGQQIGVVQQLTLDSEISSARGIFNLKNLNKDQGAGILSTSSALIPFTSSNDGNRIMFACSQQKQMLPLKNPEPPAIMTGYESILTNILSPNFVKRSPADGIVSFLSKDKIIIDSETGKRYEIDLLPVHLSSGSGRDTLSVFEPKVVMQQHIKHKEIIAEGSAIKDGTISMGRNLLVAYMPYKGYSFDDGIIINESLVKNEKLVSLHAIVEEILISENDRILYVIEPGAKTKKGDILLRKTIGEIEELLGFDEDDETAVVYGQDLIKKSPGGIVVDIEVYANVDVSKYPKIKELSDRTREHYGTAPKEKFAIRGKHIKGVLIKFKIQQEISIELGDKMAGRYGNKGVICHIESTELMPRTPWGDPVDIILNPLGVLGRMNVGQIYETYCGLISKDLAGLMTHNTKERFIQALKYVMSSLDGTKNGEYSRSLIDGLLLMKDDEYAKTVEKIKESGFFPIIIPPFKSPSVQNIKRALEVLGLRAGYHLYLPEFKTVTTNEVPIGYIYMSKLEHIARLKIHSRSTGPVTSKTGQPTAGKRRHGGQRCGELDMYSILSYNVPHLASELMSSMSDDIKSKNEMISDIVQTGETKFRYPQITPAKDLVATYFIALMLDARK